MSAVTTRDETLAKLHQLPAIPAVVQEVIASFKNTGMGSAALARKIAQSQGLSARVLRDCLKISRECIEVCLPAPDRPDAGANLMLATRGRKSCH